MPVEGSVVGGLAHHVKDQVALEHVAAALMHAAWRTLHVVRCMLYGALTIPSLKLKPARGPLKQILFDSVVCCVCA